MAGAGRREGTAEGVAGVVLAAGASERFGGSRPKALARVGPETAVRRIARILRSVGCRPVVVVAGRDLPAIAEELREEPVEVVENPDWRSGRTGSVQAGLRRVPKAAVVLIWPVDAPFVRPATVRSLLAATRGSGGGSWWTPTFEGRGGHPIALASPSVEKVAALAPDLPLRAAPFRGSPNEIRVPVDDPGVLDNGNTPGEMLEAATRWLLRGGDE